MSYSTQRFDRAYKEAVRLMKVDPYALAYPLAVLATRPDVHDISWAQRNLARLLDHPVRDHSNERPLGGRS